jgi:hypothetical protein
MIKAPKTNVVGPTVAADDPMAVASENITLIIQALELVVLARLLAEKGDNFLAQLWRCMQSSSVLLNEGQDHSAYLVVEGLALGQQHIELVLVAHDRVLTQQLAKLVTDRHRFVG